MSDLVFSNHTSLELLYQKIRVHIDTARQNTQRTINLEMVKAYWCIGKDIIEEEQQGNSRAEYGKAVLENLAKKLQNEYKRGFSVDTLEHARKFYLHYPSGTYGIENSDTLSRKSEITLFDIPLSWSHHIELMKVERIEARQFYIHETLENKWSTRELKRQINSLLFDRIAQSKDKSEILKLASEGQNINTPEDAIKDPFVLEFLGLPQTPHFTENILENAIIANLQQFLLELGKGFAFVARQKRLTLDGNHFYTDLVFYHIILKCYVVIDIKTDALTHADLGQMLFYVNYFDQEIKTENDNPTIGLVLCTQKSDAMVRYTLGEKAKQIFASKYQLYLPTEAELEQELQKEILAFKCQQ